MASRLTLLLVALASRRGAATIQKLPTLSRAATAGPAPTAHHQSHLAVLVRLPATSTSPMQPAVCLDAAWRETSEQRSGEARTVEPFAARSAEPFAARSASVVSLKTGSTKVGRVGPVQWAAASLLASAWFCLVAALSFLFPPLHRHSGRWIRTAAACTRQAFSGGPSVDLLR